MRHRYLGGGGALLVLSAGLLAAGCAPRAIQPVGEPLPDPTGAAAALAAATIPAQPQQVAFAWTLDESGSRVRGKGVLRHDAPERLRLDLFGPRNETLLAAALVGDEVRLPGRAPEGVAIPSPALLWGGLGIVRPPTGAELVGATGADSVTVLRYRAANADEFLYRVRVREGKPLLEQLERVGPSGVLETVRLERGPGGELTRSRYRDWAAFRDLTFDLESVKDVAAFPETIWRP